MTASNISPQNDDASEKYRESGRIHSLSPVVIDRIAAGEVVDGPYSVVKELMENALDAGADSLEIRTDSGGMERILIVDNGSGIPCDDLPKAVERHATSKIRELEDIEQVSSFGFRGEALASIASVSLLEIRSKHADSQDGGLLRCRGGEQVELESAACNPGTSITVRDLFYSTPARRKHLRSERSENKKIAHEVMKAAIARPDVRFSYWRDGREFFTLPPANLSGRIGAIYKSKLEDHILEIYGETEGLSIWGFVSDQEHVRGNRDIQFQYVNGRAVEIRHLSYFVSKSYGELLPKGAHPCYFLFLQVDPSRVDVNVHPAKREVRLLDESLLHSLVTKAVAKALHPGTPLEFSTSALASRSLEPPAVKHSEQGSPALTSVEELLLPAVLKERDSFDVHPPNESGHDVLVHDRVVHSSFLPQRHFGVFFGTYILAESEDSLYIIDQHTAHERINYERMRAKLESMKHSRQQLLEPALLDCLPDELSEILEKKELLADNGFLVEEYGPRNCIVREVPAYIEAGGEEEAVRHVLKRILEGEDDYRIYDEYAAMKACKASIKRNDVVSGDTLSGILRDLSRCEDPTRCPHGRPTMIRLAPRDLDRLFHRPSE